MPLGTLGYAWGSMHETYGGFEVFNWWGNLGITQQHESVHQNEGVFAIEGRGEGYGRDKDKEQFTKLQPLLRDCERATDGE